jgi:hypothetical protein
MLQPEIQVVISLLTVLGAGISVYVGVRVALAEIKTIQKQHEDELKDLAERIKYLERRAHT